MGLIYEYLADPDDPCLVELGTNGRGTTLTLQGNRVRIGYYFALLRMPNLTAKFIIARMANSSMFVSYRHPTFALLRGV